MMDSVTDGSRSAYSCSTSSMRLSGAVAAEQQREERGGDERLAEALLESLEQPSAKPVMSPMVLPRRSDTPARTATGSTGCAVGSTMP